MSNSPAAPSATWAEVRVRERVMRYHRSGAGRPVLLLRPVDDANAFWPELPVALAEGWRVLAPVIPADCREVASWLGDFLEGLGVSHIALVAAGCLCDAALAYEPTDPDLLACLVIVANDPDRRADVETRVAEGGRPASAPLLIVERQRAADEAVELVRRFIGGGTG